MTRPIHWGKNKMSIRYARSALFCPNDIEMLFGEKLWNKYRSKQITYEELCNAIRNNMYEKLKQKEELDLIKRWNPLLFNMLLNTDLRCCNKKNNDIIKSIFSYIYRSTYNAEYGNGYGYVSRVNTYADFCAKKELSYVTSRYDNSKDLYLNPSLCNANGTLYYFAEANGKEHIRKIPLEPGIYKDIASDLLNIESLDSEKLSTYLKIGIIQNGKMYDQILDVINQEEVFFDEKTYSVAVLRAKELLINNIVRFPVEKQKICDLLRNEEQNKKVPVNLVEFVSNHYKEILNIRNKRKWDITDVSIKSKLISNDCFKAEFYFSTFPNKGKYGEIIKIENVSPAKIFSSRMDAIFGEHTAVGDKCAPILFNPFQKAFYHTSRFCTDANTTKIVVNGQPTKNDIDIGQITLAVKENKVITQYKGKDVIPLYLSTYNVGNSLLLIFLRMISYVQEELYFPQITFTQVQDDVTFQDEVIVNNVMLSACRWSIPIKFFPKCKRGLFSEDEFEMLQRLMTKHKIPRFVNAYSEDSPEKRIIDLYNPFSCVQIKKYYDESQIFFEEIIVPDADAHMTQYLWEPEDI